MASAVVNNFLRPLSEVTAMSVNEMKECMGHLWAKIGPPLHQTVQSQPIGVAVSGGPDSMALLTLLSQLYPKEQLVPIFVHHNLQSRGVTESTEKVEDFISRLGLKPRLTKINWEEGELEKLKKGQMQEKLRYKRMNLLLQTCRQENVQVLLTGHHADDNIVTMMYRLSHGSGTEGLAGIKTVSYFPVGTMQENSKCLLAHPLLNIPKARLMETCKSMNIPWSIDESNLDLEYNRNDLLDALCSIQKEEALPFEHLHDMQQLFRQYAADIHSQLSPIFNKSISVNKSTGEALLVMNNSDFVRNWPLFSRVMTILVHFAGAKYTPLRTSRLLEVRDELSQAYEEYERERVRLNRRNYGIQRLGPDSNRQPITATERLESGQVVIGGVSIYPLSRSDGARRLNIIKATQRRVIEPGPVLLIQRQPFSGANRTEATNLNAVKFSLQSGGGPYLWDNRLEIKYSDRNTNDESLRETREFQISHLTMGDIKELQKMEKIKGLGGRFLKNLYATMGSTPATHLYIHPLIKEIGSDYVALPTMGVESEPEYEWSVSCISLPVLLSKFQFRP